MRCSAAQVVAVVAVVAVVWLTACAAPPRSAPPSSLSSGAPASPAPASGGSAGSPLAAQAIAGIDDPTLRAIVADHWEQWMRWAPTLATSVGDHRYDDQLGRHDAASIAAHHAARDALITRLAALAPGGLGDRDRVTQALLRGELEADRASDVCRLHEWTPTTVIGELSHLVESQTVTTPGDAAHLIARLAQGVRVVDETIANLRRGLATGRVASAERLRRAIEQLDRELARPVERWIMMAPAWAKPPSPDPWPAGERDRQVRALGAVVSGQLRPALVRLSEFLRSEVAPRARGDREGVGSLPDGDACYRALIVHHVGLVRSPQELHQLGLTEIARTDRELAALGKTVLHAADLAATIARLRGDRTLYFANRDELLGAAQRSLDRAKAAIPRFFSPLPRADCAVRETPAYAAPYSTTAYYSGPHYDGTKPGEYFVNTYQPETRPRYELEALTWHESIPGHHLQIAIAQELGDLPMFRKLSGSTAFVEGWALYTERLADEMGLYSSDTDRLGKLSFDAWRAARLVVDTGIHAMGWTRAQAEAFLRAHTALTDGNISNEVNRYISGPAQALAYKVGQLEILKLRGEAEAALGERFDIKAFHAAVLGGGAVTLPVLDARVRAWIAASAR